MKIIIGAILILSFVFTDDVFYYGYEYNANIKKLSLKYTNEIQKIGFFIPRTHDDITQEFSKKPFQSSMTLSKISLFSTVRTPSSWNITVDKDNKCFNASHTSPGIVLYYGLHYLFRYVGVEILFGNATLEYSFSYIEVVRCYASPDLKLITKGSSRVVSGDILSRPIGKEPKIYPVITKTFDNNMTSDLTQIIKSDLLITIFNDELEFMNYKTFQVRDDTFNFSNTRASINYFVSSKNTDYFSFEYTSNLFSGHSPTPIPITGPSILDSDVTYDNVNLICTNIHNGLAAMNLFFDQYKFILPVNSSAISVGQISQNYFTILPELATYLSGYENVDIMCKKIDTLTFYSDAPENFNRTINLPLYCSFSVLKSDNPFLEVISSFHVDSNLQQDTNQGLEGFKFVLAIGVLKSFTTTAKLTPPGRTQLTNILNQVIIDLLKPNIDGTNKWDPFWIPFPSPSDASFTQTPILRKNESCFYFS